MTDTAKQSNDLARAEARIVRDPDIRGGIPTIKGTRISPYEVSGFTDFENMESFLAKHYPSLTLEDVRLAAIYVAAHPPLRNPLPQDFDAWKKEWKLVESKSVPLKLDP